ncbi:acyl carrier protein [Streptomyces hayashii]
MAAGVLGHPSPDGLDVGRDFLDQGFASLTGVELRTRLAAATGLDLPAALIYDFPGPADVAAHLLERMFDREAAAGPSDRTADADADAEDPSTPHPPLTPTP